MIVLQYPDPGRTLSRLLCTAFTTNGKAAGPAVAKVILPVQAHGIHADG